MKELIFIGLGGVMFLAIPALAQETGAPVEPAQHHRVYHHVHHVYHHAHRAVVPAPVAQNAPAPVAPGAAPGLPSFFPHIAPYPDGKGDEDGLSENPDDCNKGCIGGNSN